MKAMPVSGINLEWLAIIDAWKLKPNTCHKI